MVNEVGQRRFSASMLSDSSLSTVSRLLINHYIVRELPIGINVDDFEMRFELSYRTHSIVLHVYCDVNAVTSIL